MTRRFVQQVKIIGVNGESCCRTARRRQIRREWRMVESPIAAVPDEHADAMTWFAPVRPK